MFPNSLKTTQFHPIYRGTLFLCSSGDPQGIKPREGKGAGIEIPDFAPCAQGESKQFSFCVLFEI